VAAKEGDHFADRALRLIGGNERDRPELLRHTIMLTLDGLWTSVDSLESL
jgi:hypothetical protein